MSGMFVDEKDTFDITVFYVENDKGIKILEEKNSDCKSLTITFKRPDFNMAQQIMNNCTESSDSGPIINIFKLRNSLIYFLSKKWDAVDGKKEAVELNNDNIGKLQPEMVSFFVQKIQDEVGKSLLIA